MEFKWCLFFVACVCGYPVQKEHNNVLLKNYNKKSIPVNVDVKDLEGEIWKAASVKGDLDIARVQHLRALVERNLLKSALAALVNVKKDPVRAKRDLQELDSIFRREKRAVQTLLSLIPMDERKFKREPEHAKPGLKLFLERNLVKGIQPSNQKLVRKTRQGKSQTHDTTEDFSNEIIPLSMVMPQASLTANDDLAIVTPIEDKKIEMAGLMNMAMPNDSSAANTNREQVTDNPQKNSNSNSTFAKQEEGAEEDEEEGGGGLGGLLTSFLGSLSTPEGGVDLDAVTGLLGGISTQNDDGSYDFTGLQDTVGSLFGGSEEGGSNVGSFLGGLVGAILRGSAGDDASTGAGRLAGNLLSALLPGLSAFPTPEDADGEPGKTPEGLDSGGFLTGFLSTIISGLGGSSNSNSSGGGGEKPPMGGGGSNVFQFKLQIVKTLFSVLTKILGASSTSKNQH